MINAITGVPGEGKTCFSVQHIILKELMVGDRPIFSNVAWHKHRPWLRYLSIAVR